MNMQINTRKNRARHMPMQRRVASSPLLETAASPSRGKAADKADNSIFVLPNTIHRSGASGNGLHTFPQDFPSHRPTLF